MPLATETGSNDMLTVNETGAQAGRFLFRTHETATSASIVRIDLFTGIAVIIFQRSDVERLDGLRWTSYGTLITGEEVKLSSLADPDVQTDASLVAGAPPHSSTDLLSKYSGLIYEIINPLGANPTVIVRPDLGGLSHEGIEQDQAGHIYVMDEFAEGSIYRFTPDTANDLSSGQLQVLRMVDNDLTSNPDRLGDAQWVDLDMADARINARGAASDVNATLFDRPEDAEITVRGGKEFLHVPITGEDRVLSIELAATPVTRSFADVTTIDLATGGAVGVAFDSPDNVTSDATGRVFITEDAPRATLVANGFGDDIWQAIDADADGIADSVAQFASLATEGAEPTGIYINPLDPSTMFVNVQHPDSGNDITFKIRSLSGDFSSFTPLGQSVALGSRPETDPFDLPEGYLAEIVTQRKPGYAGDDPLLDASAADESLDMTSAAFDFDTEISRSSSLYVWSTAGGHRIYAEGTGFTASGGRPTGGIVHTVHIDLGADGTFVAGGAGSDIDFTASRLVLALADLDTTAAWFWTKLLKGTVDVSGGASGDVLTGNDHANSIIGHGGGDTILAAGGRDSVRDGTGNDYVDLGAGNDYVRVGGGADTFIGGAGKDYISYYNASSGVTLDLAANTAAGSWAANDTISGFESASGSRTGRDTIFGSSASNTIKTYGGNDVVRDRAGDDRVRLGDGNDYLAAGRGSDDYDGGAGRDYISYANAPGGVTVDLLANTASGSWANGDTISGFEKVSGSKTGNDTISGTNGANTIRTYGGDDDVFDRGGNDKVELGAGQDFVRVGGGNDKFDGGAGQDMISYVDSAGGVRIDLEANTVSGSMANGDIISSFESAAGSNTGNDSLKGTSGANTLRGNGGNDKLAGRGGNDKLFGGKGHDKLIGGKGDDELRGNGGEDTFHFDKKGDHDTIKDFRNNVDTIELDNFGFATVAKALTFATQAGGDVTFNFGGGDILTVENATIGQLGNDIDIV